MKLYNRREVGKMLAELRRQREAWKDARREFQSEYAETLRWLILEAAATLYSLQEISEILDVPQKTIKAIAKKDDLNFKHDRVLLSHSAVNALRENAALMGINPEDFDLLSPLAYLPMGEELRKSLQQQCDKPSQTTQTQDEWDETGETMLRELAADISSSELALIDPEDLARYLLDLGWHK